MKQTRLIPLFLLMLVLPYVTFGQGSLRGTVTDSLAKTPMVGANVFLVGTGLGCATDVDGQYKINGISPGKHILKVSSIGYAPKEVQIIFVSGAPPVQLNFELSPMVMAPMSWACAPTSTLFPSVGWRFTRCILVPPSVTPW